MSIDTPATIAILGAGPIGLEAALYARFMGYDVDLYERGDVACNVLAWGHVRMFSPFEMNRSTLGLAAIQAQDGSWAAPDDDAVLTGREWAKSYLLSLSRTDLLKRNIHTQTRVLGVSRTDQLKHESVGQETRTDTPFQLLVEDEQGERTAEADIVIDTTGVYGQHNWLGSGGLPVVGERIAAEQIRYDAPDILELDRALYAGKETVIVGGGYSAATSVVALAKLAAENPTTRGHWLVRREDHEQGPVPQIPDDALTERDELAKSAAAIALESDGAIAFLPGTGVEKIETAADTGRLTITTRGQTETTIECDQIIANVGYHGDRTLYQQLQIHECYATGGPMKLAASLAKNASIDCLTQESGGVETLVTTEPNFYILGSKCYGRDSRFLVSIGLEQIRELFGLIGGRATLNLYQDVQGLISS